MVTEKKEYISVFLILDKILDKRLLNFVSPTDLLYFITLFKNILKMSTVIVTIEYISVHIKMDTKGQDIPLQLTQIPSTITHIWQGIPSSYTFGGFLCPK